MNIKLMKEVRCRILKAPSKFNMRSFFGDKEGNTIDLSDLDPETNFCGTTACIAGHAILAAGIDTRKLDEVSLDSLAGALLGLTQEQNTSLFYAGSWAKWCPEAIKAHYKAKTSTELAKAAVIAIDKAIAEWA